MAVAGHTIPGQDPEVAEVEQLLDGRDLTESRYDRALIRERTRATDVDRTLLLFHAHCAAGHVDEVRRMLQRDMDVNAGDGFARTALHAACLHGQEDIVSLLLREGADVDAVEERRGDMPLHYGALSGSEKCGALMLAAGADVDAQNQGGQTPLMLAAQARHASLLRLLASECLEPDAQDAQGWTLLHYCAWQDVAEPISYLLEELHVDPWVRANDGSRAVDVAQLHGCAAAREVLVRWTSVHTEAVAKGKLL